MNLVKLVVEATVGSVDELVPEIINCCPIKGNDSKVEDNSFIDFVIIT